MSASVMSVGTVLALSVVLAGGASAVRASVEVQRVSAAADAAALAAADAAMGLVRGGPCEVAAKLARAHAARLDGCDIETTEAVVSVSTEVLGRRVSVTAKAGGALPPVDTGPFDPGELGENGKLPESSLSPIAWQTDLLLRTDAAAALTALNAAYREEFGRDLVLTDAYRDLQGQEVQRAQWCAQGACAFAATPGTSTHGWGTAIDVNLGRTAWTDPTYVWLQAHASAFGWHHPAWAEPEGATPEAWHWEYGGGR